MPTRLSTRRAMGPSKRLNSKDVCFLSDLIPISSDALGEIIYKSITQSEKSLIGWHNTNDHTDVLFCSSTLLRRTRRSTIRTCVYAVAAKERWTLLPSSRAFLRMRSSTRTSFYVEE